MTMISYWVDGWWAIRVETVIRSNNFRIIWRMICAATSCSSVVTGSAARTCSRNVFYRFTRPRRAYLASRPVRPWVFGIARHVFQMDCRFLERRYRHETRFPLSELSFSGEIERLLARDAIEDALFDLPPDRQELLILHYGLGFSFS